MQLGMIGLGRMGANMVRRLELAGHECVGYDIDADAVTDARRRGHDRRHVTHRPRRGSSPVRGTCGSWCRPRSSTRRSPRWRRCSAEGDAIIDGGNSWYHDDIRRPGALAADHGIEYVDVGVSGGTHGLERGYCLMIGGPADAVERLTPIFDALAPGVDTAERTPERLRIGDAPSPAERGWLHCGPTGAGHFVKMVHNGIEYGLMAAYAEGLNVLAKAGHRRRDARRRRRDGAAAEPRVLPLRPRPGGDHRALASRVGRVELAARPDRPGARRRSARSTRSRVG